jgi:two-component sensor histidine kinase
VKNVQTTANYEDQEGARRQGLVSLLAGPLSVREEVKGVFISYTDREHTFTQEEEALLLTLCNQMALAIEHARLATNAAMTREIHHRIKNNLQTVAMLIQLQLAEVTHAGTRQMLESSMNRVYSIAAVHEVLAERGFHLVNVKEVLQRLATMNIASLTAPGHAYRVTIEGEAMMLPSRAATNVALVVNELLQNALEHGFADRDQGEVQITLASVPAGLVIAVRDNGRGLPVGYRPGLGTEIVRTLVREELRGRLEYHATNEGTEVILRLPADIAGENA